MSGDAGEVTLLLERWNSGDRNAASDLVPLLWSPLRALAASYMSRERTAHTLQPTALVNEVYLRLLEQKRISFNDRQQFLSFAARLMRNILVDSARTRLAQRRGGKDIIRVPLDEDAAWIGSSPEAMIDLNAALDRLEAKDSRKAQAIHLRFFLEMSNDEAAETLGVSAATMERDLKFAKSWLFRELHSGSLDPAGMHAAVRKGAVTHLGSDADKRQ